MSSSLYIGQVMHQRFFPMTYKFKYNIFSIRVDVDAIEQESRNHWLLSLDRFNWISLYRKDYGARSDQSWRSWFTELMQDYGVTKPVARLELVCMPRYLGFTFNPLAMWYGFDEQDQLVAVVAEVSNTFGQWHHYVLTNQGLPLNERISASADKVFHVSPFMNMECRYRFRLHKPDKDYQIGIYETENDQPVLNAVQVGKQQQLTTQNLIKAALKMPFNTLKVMILIHWWALKIWLKGGTFHRTPKHLENIQYSHTEMKRC